MTVIHILAWLVGLIFAGLLVYAFWVEPFKIELNRVDIHIPGLPQALDGFTICHLSDLHTSRIGRLEEEFMRILSTVDADLGVITGDLVRKRKRHEAVLELLADFKPRLGVFAVSGNSDYRLRVSLDHLIEDLHKLDIHFLLNQNFLVYRNAYPVQIIGVEDPFTARDDIKKAMEGLGEDGFKLLLAHSPDILNEPASRQVDLILAGHTHGGQVRFPCIGAIWLHCRYHLGLSDGLYRPDDLRKKLKSDEVKSFLYISRGLGSSNIVARFLCRPEIVLITLRNEFQ